MKKIIVLLTVIAMLAALCACGRTDTAATQAPTEAAQAKCKVTVECASVLNNMDALSADKAELIPADGVLLPETEVAFADGETVYDVLVRLCKEKGIVLDAPDTVGYGHYVSGVNNLYSGDCGDLSGWMVSVDGTFPSEGISNIKAEENRVIAVRYTCDMGGDIGASYN